MEKWSDLEYLFPSWIVIPQLTSPRLASLKIRFSRERKGSVEYLGIGGYTE